MSKEKKQKEDNDFSPTPVFKHICMPYISDYVGVDCRSYDNKNYNEKSYEKKKLDIKNLIRKIVVTSVMLAIIAFIIICAIKLSTPDTLLNIEIGLLAGQLSWIAFSYIIYIWQE